MSTHVRSCIQKGCVALQARGEATLLGIEERLRGALNARYQLLFNQIGRIEGGVKFLVDMRADILVNINFYANILRFIFTISQVCILFT